MLDMDTEVYELIKTLPAGVTWSPGWPQDFSVLSASNGIGCWKIKSNGNAGGTSSRREWLSKVVVEIQIWAATPELRAGYEKDVDEVFGAYFTRSPAGGHLEEQFPTEQTAYRSILTYEATVRDDYTIVS